MALPFVVGFAQGAVAQCDPATSEVGQFRRLHESALAKLDTFDDGANYPGAIETLRCLSEAGYAASSLALAYVYFEGAIVPEDKGEAISFLVSAARDGDTDQVYEVAQSFKYGHFRLFRFDPEPARANDLLTEAAYKGSVKAQLDLCEMYQSGSLVEQNFDVAIDFCRRAAENGDGLAEIHVADLLSDHGRYPKDAAEAVAWYKKSACRGTNSGPLGMGKVYEKGVGVLQDYKLAHAWYNIASSQLSPESQELAAKERDRVAAKLSDEQVIEAQQLASALSQQIASKTGICAVSNP